MSALSKVLIVLAAIVGAFYLLETVLSFLANGLTGPLFVKFGIFLLCAFYVWQRVRLLLIARPKPGPEDAPPGD